LNNWWFSRSREWKGEKPVHRVFNSDVLASPMRTLSNRTWSAADLGYIGILGGLHLGALAAPFFFTWPAFASFFFSYIATGCIGITFCYHRQLAHKSFKTPKWVEYLAAYCGVHALQGDPVVWVSSHRYHHQYTDTPNDPHTPYEGFFWSHIGWLLDSNATLTRVSDRNNASDLLSQPFYRFLSKTYLLHHIAAGAAMFYFGGWSMFLWTFCFRAVFVYHVTWAVNSVCHVWGGQEYKTGDLSRNNPLIGILAFGEGWHNNHHAVRSPDAACLHHEQPLSTFSTDS
jgi:stearoyl-CoA desaturase (delta-9 desaturase)